MSGKRFAVVGSGMQGSAATYDIARFAEGSSVVVADLSAERAQAAADRANRLTGRDACKGVSVDASNEDAVTEFLKQGFDVVLSAVPYHLHATVENAAFRAGVSATDLGNDTDVTIELLKRDEEAKAKGITIVPDVGLAPGFVNSIALVFMERLDEVSDVRIYCGGLPQNPKPPFNYTLVFSMEGLVGEYIDEAISIRDHKPVRLQTLEDYELVDVPVLGRMEAFNTSSGTSTAPYTFQSKIRNYDYKTLRYPGHCELMRLFRDCGFWSEEPIEVDGAKVSPFNFFCKLMEPVFKDPTSKDVTVIMAVGEGTKNGVPARIQADVLDYYDESTGFSSMERLTGFSAAIMTIAVAEGRVRKGCVPYECALSGSAFVAEVERRGIPVKFTQS